MVRDWGMTEEVGFVFYGSEEDRGGMMDFGGRTYSDKTAEAIDIEIKRFLDSSYEHATKTITDNRAKLEDIAQALLKFETISGEEVNALIRGETIERATVTDLLDEATSAPQVGVARPVSSDPQAEPDLGDGPLPQPG